ncbi:MAG TPA: hypothetical protein VFA07_06415 [Chthonomonadaceae bacterium]|nr:hypothetical protein [Chthonomonadaceae bacterium]
MLESTPVTEDTFEAEFDFVYRLYRVFVGKETLRGGNQVFAIRISDIGLPEVKRVLLVPDAEKVYRETGEEALILLIKHHIEKQTLRNRKNEQYKDVYAEVDEDKVDQEELARHIYLRNLLEKTSQES